jgi:hypothetical protein
MRKPSKMLQYRIPLALAAVLAAAACSSDREAADGASTASVAVAKDGAIGSVGGAVVGGLPAIGEDRPEQLAASAPPPSPAPVAPEMAMTDMARPVETSAAAAVGNGVAQSRQRASSARRDAGTADFVRGAPLTPMDVTGAMLVRNGQASIEVRGIDAAITAVRQAAAQHGGFVANTSFRGGKEEQRLATLEIRVPSDKFDGLLSGLSQLGKVESVTASVQDVGEEYVDLGARAANARRVEARLVEMLATRTGRLSDVLTVEQELARVRMEAERYDARLRWLERQATLSSLSITMHEPRALLDPQRGPGPLAEALARAWTRMIGVVAWSIAALGVLVPLFVLIGLGVLAARRLFGGGTPPGVTKAG